MYDNTFEVKYKWILDYVQFFAFLLVQIKAFKGWKKWRPERSEWAVEHCSMYDVKSHVPTWVPRHVTYICFECVCVCVYPFGMYTDLSPAITNRHEFIEYLSYVQPYFSCS